ncbi:hypothetical protein GCM10009551_064700 [Nocardiopsis tropica]
MGVGSRSRLRTRREGTAELRTRPAAAESPSELAADYGISRASVYNYRSAWAGSGLTCRSNGPGRESAGRWRLLHPLISVSTDQGSALPVPVV